ncbi:MAG: putative beta-lysine N-acetyltransferase [Thermodesulfobacteriota bacterium]|nr:putative beta-lysine N-acetyltransferase [Thermodesulfobacteriota bacterium]
MTDTVTTMGRSIVQHGPLNNRAYLMSPHPEDVPWIVEKLYKLASTKGYSKILARIPASMERIFLESRYVREAVVPGYLISGEALLFVSRFLRKSRGRENYPDRVAQNFALIEKHTRHHHVRRSDLPAIRLCKKNDRVEIAQLFRQVFASYPFPVDDPEYLTHTMASHTRYYCTTENGRIVGVCASEMDMDNLAVEMTDFAVVPEMRGRGLAAYLLAEMERDMCSRGMRTAFTIARTLSPGMNLIFKQMNYRWGGTLVNNTNISGGIESMWVWHKRLEK